MKAIWIPGDAMQAGIQGYGMRSTIKTDAAKCNPRLSQDLASDARYQLFSGAPGNNTIPFVFELRKAGKNWR